MYANSKADPAMSAKDQHQLAIPPSLPQPAAAHRDPGVVELIPIPPVSVPARMGEVGAEIAEEFEWMAARFGPPPLKRIAISPIPGTFGQGFPGLIYLSTVTYLDDAQRRALLRKDASAETFYNSIIHAHETAHQWWGNLVIPATYHDDWIAEALANYTAMLVLEQKRGTKALEMALDDYRKDLLAPGKPTTVESYGPITWGYRLRENGQLDPWRAIIYGKGTWIIHMLRCRMGDEAFLRMLATLRKHYEYRTLSTEEFRAHASLFLPLGDPDPSLESFFDTWVYGTGIPTLEMATSVKGKAPAVTLTVTVRQSGAGEDFVAEVPVEIRTAPGVKPIVRWVHTSSEPAVFTLKLKAPPQHVELAPRLAVLARGKGA
jgi:aminopeptidase N